MRRHAGVQGGGLHVVVDEPRARKEPSDAAPLAWPEDPAAVPYLDAQGELVLPTNCPTRFRWWAGGQGIAQTLKEVR